MKTEKTPDGIKITDISGLSLPETLDCGQCFRWKADSEGNWCGVVKGISRKIRKEENGITILGADEQEFEKIGENIFIAKSAKVAPTAFINGPCIIDEDAEIRHCAFIRGNAIVGKGAVVGNSTELKNVILFDKAQVPHYNYVGDSVIGFRSHMGAGAITSNLKSDKTLVTIKTPEGRLETGLKKFGAMLGDNVEVGCGSVLNPGTVIGSNTNVYPLSSVRGFIPKNSIYKNMGEIAEKR